MARISVELSPLVVQRLKESSLGGRVLTEEAVRMLRYGLKQLFPPRTPDEWRHQVGKEDWKELGQASVQTLMRKSKENVNQEVPLDQPYVVVLEVPSDMAAKIEELAQSKQMTVSEAAVYTIQYALTEVFPPRTEEELKKEIADTWRGIFRAMWKRS